MKPSAIGAEDLMHATLVRRPFNRTGWGFEHKLDGFRALARREGDRVNLLSRTGRLLSTQFPEVISALRGIDGNYVLDGELVVPNAKGTRLSEGVRRRGVMKVVSSINAAVRTAPAALCVFDVLLVDHNDLRRPPLGDRRDRLAKLLEPSLGLQLMRSLEEHGEALFEQAAISTRKASSARMSRRRTARGHSTPG